MAKALSRKVTIYINGREIESTLKSLEAELVKLKNEQRAATIGSEEYIKTSLKIKELNSVINEQKRAVQGLGDSWKETRTKLADYSNMIMGMQSVFEMIDIGVGKLKDLARDAAALDDVYADVMKTTGLTHEQVEKLNEAFKKMDTRTSREQLNQLAYEAGKLGIESEEAIKQFVSASDKINIALGDVLGEGAMVTIGKLTNIYESVSSTLDGKNLEEKMLAIGSAVNSLGQASTANEGYMVEFMKRLGGIASQAKLSADQVLGYASALDQNGQAVEMSATAFMKLIQQMVKKPEEFVQAAGVSMEEFKRMMDEDMNGAIMRVLEGMEKGGGFQQLIGMFADMGLDGARAATVVSSLAKHLDQVREAQALANTEMQTGTSVINEFNTKNDTLQAQAEKAKKKFEEMRIELGNELYPVLISLQRSGTVLMKGVAGTIQLFKEYPALIAPVITGLIAMNRYRIINLVTSKKLVNALETLTGRKKIEAVATALSAKNEAKLVAGKEASTLQYYRSRLAVEKETLARQQSSSQTIIQEQAIKTKNRVRVLEILETEQATKAELAHAAAVRASRAAWMAVPWGIILTAVAAVTAGIVSLVRKASEVKTVAKEIADAGVEAESKIRVMQDRLDDSKKGTDDYKKALGELKEMYPDIIKQFVDETGALNDVKSALEAVSAASKQAAMDQLYNQKAGDIYSEEAKKIQEAMETARKITEKTSLNFWKEGTSNAQREEAWRRYTEWVRKAQNGTVSWDAAIKGAQEDLGKMGYVLTSTFGSGSNDMIYQMRKMAKATGETEDKVRELNETLKSLYSYSAPQATNTDPYGLAGKSVKDLNTLLAETKKYMNDVASNEQDPFGAQKALVAARKVAAIERELNNRKKKQTDSGGGYTPHGESDKERKAREKQEAREAKRIADAWNKAQEDAKKMTDKFNLQAESGLQKVKDDVDAKTEEMIARLRETAEEAGESADDLENKLREAAENYKESQVKEYLEKVTAEVDRLKKATAKSEGGERLNKVSQAAENLRQQLEKVDELLKKLESDLGKAVEGSDTYNWLQAEIKRLKAIKKDAVSAAFSQFDFKVKNPFEEQSQFNLKDNQARVLDEVKKKVEEYSKAIDDAVGAYSRMAEVARSAGNEDKAKEYEAEAAALKKQSEGIEDISKKAEELAKKNALKETINAWCDGIQQFTDQALSIFGNINSLLDNIADSELQKMERQKDAAIENLDEQLEQGLISQEQYEEQKKTLEDDYAEKEKEVKLEQWRRQKALDLTQAIIGGALAAVRAYAEGGPYAGPFLAAMITAATGLQIAAIENQPEPYAKGGYVPRRTVYQAGEAGPEWVASNSLLNDPQAAPIIKQLEAYQRGNRRALADIPMEQINMPVATAAALELGRRSTGAVSVAAMPFNQQPQQMNVSMPEDGEMMKLWRELASYLKDPNNRRAVISRQTMTDFESNENFLRNRARL